MSIVILVNSKENVKYTGNTCISGNLDHSMVYCAYSVCKQKFKPQIIKRRDLRNFATDKFKQEMQNAPWNTIKVTDQTDIDLATTALEDIYTKIINNNAPYREISVTKPVNASWMDDDVIFLMDLRDKYRKKHANWSGLRYRIAPSFCFE